MDLKGLNHLDYLDDLEQIKALEKLEESKRKIISSISFKLKKLENFRIITNTDYEKKQALINYLTEIEKEYSYELRNFELEAILKLKKLIKELIQLKEEIKGFINKNCNPTLFSDDVQKLSF